MGKGGESVLLDDIAFLLARASAAGIAAGNDSLQPLGLTVRAFATLTLAVEHDGITQRGISEFLRLDPSRVVAIVDDLENRGFVSRLVGRGDRRMKIVVATPAGHALFKQAVAATRAGERDLFQRLTPEARTEAIRVLRQLAFPDDG
ncbi:MarR family winged helix-turn-helix transcriptional regulator [Agromyces albus]|uniref:MarR family winged helix-turn-helix transcriptional regulator n=1 Tax=Agromyces albus TaxID=205332 RepID=UPI00278AD0F5|nr:MarR family transcriptional regulator [Agromyces albus]MDQ0576238.1 DNA-binding MarR family transcriptional regulator [Agromyces albus]